MASINLTTTFSPVDTIKIWNIIDCTNVYDCLEILFYVSASLLLLILLLLILMLVGLICILVKLKKYSSYDLESLPDLKRKKNNIIESSNESYSESDTDIYDLHDSKKKRVHHAQRPKSSPSRNQENKQIPMKKISRSNVQRFSYAEPKDIEENYERIKGNSKIPRAKLRNEEYYTGSDSNHKRISDVEKKSRLKRFHQQEPSIDYESEESTHVEEIRDSKNRRKRNTASVV
ncbi:unnamed protein product [Brachionus calyciflorus]|uniref:Uncharacterized protein n=1 Tax=Brachionus calyciflorus TaxID=104777 RepID=A0A813M3N8_9BILA|nr:unnamed protein product [Brachionus calyciflorus]